MRAMVLHQLGEPLRLEARPEPIAGAGQVLVKVDACGVCRIDLHVVDGELAKSDRPAATPVSVNSFLSADAYLPLPTLVQAARALMKSGSIRTIHRARAATEPAIAEITRIIHEAARTKTRHLILLTGVPGAGKTLVGLQIVHAHFLDDLAVPRANGKPTAPAVFLSGNGPLVAILREALTRDKYKRE